MSRFSRFSKQSQSSSSAAPSNSQKGAQKTQVRDYFDEDDDEDDQIHASKPNLNDGDDDYDPLDAFMDNINQQVAKEKEITQTKPVSLPEIVSYGDHDSGFGEDDVDDLEDTEANARFIASDDEEEEVGGDRRSLNESMKNPKGKLIEPLPRVDHSQIQYKPFKKRFYSESNELKSLSSEEISQWRKELELTVTPSSFQIHCPSPVKTFRQCGFPIQLLKEIENQGYEKPTAIQAQSIPIILSGNDLLALAKTGSGKTLAYVWPMLIHILDQPQMKIGDGPIALVLVPTRELANQIFVEVKKYAKLFQIRFTVIYGGAGKYEMSKSLKESPEIVIATPGRLIEMIKMKATNLLRLTYIVLDEADRMFEMGFEYQIRSILYNIQPSKQLLMFSATMKKRIENFAREMFTNNNEVRVVVGMIGQANADIQQLTHIVPDVNEKWLWLASEIDEFAANGKVLIFVLSKSDTEELTYKLREFFQRRQLDIQVDCIHGDKDQSERSKIMNRFAKKSLLATSEGGGGGSKEELTILVATDIASRGLDVKDIRTVINYDVAKNIETYVHRIGRTGRMGVEGVTPGTAYTLLTPKDSSFAVDLVQNLRLSGQPIAEDLIHLAMKDSKWNKIRHFHHQGGLGSGAGRFSSAPRHQGMGGSLSSFAGVNRAMTSEMMANSTQQAMQINLPQGLMQAYQEKIESRNMSTCEEEPKRKSRFSAAPAATQPIAVSNQPLTGFVVSSLSSNPSTLHQSSNPSNPNNPLMKGFVKASSTYSSVSTASTNSSTNQQEQARKKTRWG